MSLLNPTWAEMADRVSILIRKVIEAEDVGEATAEFVEEITAIKTAMQITPREELILDLAVINGAIWNAIDAEQPGKAQDLNYRRAELRQEKKL